MKKTALYIIFLLNTIIASAQVHMPAGADEGIFTIKYSDFSMDVTTLVYKDSVYIPMVDFLNMMKVYVDISDMSRVSGYLFNRDSSYALNTPEMNYLDIGGARHPLPENSFIRGATDMYVLPSVMAGMFKIDISVRTRNLRIYVQSKYKFPLLLEAEREQKYFAANPAKFNGEEELPVLYGRDWKLLDGGMLNYSLTSSQTNQYQSYTANANVGFQVLGGELTYSLSSGYSMPSRTWSKGENYRWRYSFTENPYISQFIYGSVSNSSVRGGSIVGMSNKSRSLKGVQVSNEPTRMPTSFNTFTIQDKIEPDWQVELYVNSQLYAQMRSDNLGYYRFDLPINYGNTNIDVRIYGPHGEFISKRELVSVPSEFLAPGSVRYVLTGGEDISDHTYSGSANLSVGITPWFTNSVSFQKDYKAREYELVNNSSFQVLNNLILNTSFEVENFYKAGLKLYTENWGTYDLIYGMTEAQGNSMNDRMHSADLTAGLPRMFGLPFNLTIRANRVENSSIATTSANTGFSYHMGSWGINTQYQAQYYENKQNDWNMFKQYVNSTLDFSWYSKPKWLRWLGNTRFAVGSSYDFYQKELGAVSLSVSQEIAKVIMFNASGQYMPDQKTYSFHLGASWNTPAFRFNSNMSGAEKSESSYSQDITGSLKYDSNRGKLFLTNSGAFNSSSSGGASIRFYVDKNANGILDAGDIEINDGGIYVPGANIERDKNGIFRVLNLLPGGRYNLYVRQNAFKNPTIAAKISRFAFIADPNSMKQIDIPCYITGTIEGNVFRLDTANKLSGQSGVKIHLVNQSDSTIYYSVPVFSDGSFFKGGLIPGKYSAFVDTVQLAILNSVSSPGTIDFVINESNDGDFLSNINFEVAGKTARPGLYASGNKKEGIADAHDTKKTEDNPDNRQFSVPDSAIVPQSVTDANPDTEPSISEPQKSTIVYPGNKVIQFAGTKSINLSKDAIKYLDILAEYLQNNPKARMSIVGHTDNFGSRESNMDISVKRAEAVVKYLTKKGIEKNRLLFSGKGALVSVGLNNTPEGREKNRRVVIELIK